MGQLRENLQRHGPQPEHRGLCRQPDWLPVGPDCDRGFPPVRGNRGQKYRDRFHTITGDPDDDAFADCAIAENADFIITSDHHFKALIGSGYRPQPITPEDFIRLHLAGV